MNKVDPKKMFWWSFGVTVAIAAVLIIAFNPSGKPAPQPSLPIGWVELQPEGAGFSALMPDVIETDAKTNTYYAGDPDKARFFITFSPILNKSADSQMVFQEALSGLTNNPEHRLMNSENTLHGKYQARDFVVWNNATNTYYRGRLIFANGTLYQMFITTYGENFPKEEYAYFLDSFKVISTAPRP